MYKDHTGANIDDYDKRAKYRYNFILIWKDPMQRLYKNLDNRVK